MRLTSTLIALMFVLTQAVPAWALRPQSGLESRDTEEQLLSQLNSLAAGMETQDLRRLLDYFSRLRIRQSYERNRTRALLWRELPEASPEDRVEILVGLALDLERDRLRWEGTRKKTLMQARSYTSVETFFSKITGRPPGSPFGPRPSLFPLVQSAVRDLSSEDPSGDRVQTVRRVLLWLSELAARAYSLRESRESVRALAEMLAGEPSAAGMEAKGPFQSRTRPGPTRAWLEAQKIQAASPDGSRMAYTLNGNRIVEVVADGSVRLTLWIRREEADIARLGFHRSRDRIAAELEDGSLVMWSLENGMRMGKASKRTAQTLHPEYFTWRTEPDPSTIRPASQGPVDDLLDPADNVSLSWRSRDEFGYFFSGLEGTEGLGRVLVLAEDVPTMESTRKAVLEELRGTGTPVRGIANPGGMKGELEWNPQLALVVGDPSLLDLKSRQPPSPVTLAVAELQAKSVPVLTVDAPEHVEAVLSPWIREREAAILSNLPERLRDPLELSATQGEPIRLVVADADGTAMENGKADAAGETRDGVAGLADAAGRYVSLTGRDEETTAKRLGLEKLSKKLGPEKSDRVQVFGRYGSWALLPEILQRIRFNGWNYLTPGALKRALTSAAQPGDTLAGFRIGREPGPPGQSRPENPDMKVEQFGDFQLYTLDRPEGEQVFAMIVIPRTDPATEDPRPRIAERLQPFLPGVRFTYGTLDTINLSFVDKWDLIEYLAETSGIPWTQITYLGDHAIPGSPDRESLERIVSMGGKGILVGADDPTLPEGVIRSRRRGPAGHNRAVEIWTQRLKGEEVRVLSGLDLRILLDGIVRQAPQAGEALALLKGHYPSDLAALQALAGDRGVAIPTAGLEAVGPKKFALPEALEREYQSWGEVLDRVKFKEPATKMGWAQDVFESLEKGRKAFGVGNRALGEGRYRIALSAFVDAANSWESANLSLSWGSFSGRDGVEAEQLNEMMRLAFETTLEAAQFSREKLDSVAEERGNGIQVTVLSQDDPNPFPWPTESPEAPTLQIFLIDPVRLHATQKAMPEATILVHDAKWFPPSLKIEVRLLPMEVGKVEPKAIVLVDNEPAPKGLPPGVAVVDLKRLATHSLPSILREALSQWTGKPVGQVFLIQKLDDGRLAVYV